MDINPKCPFCENFMEDIDHLFKNCDLSGQIWKKIAGNCPNPISNDMQFIDWIELVFKNEKSYRTM